LALGLGLLTLRIVKADDGDYYNFDHEDYWKEYREFSYPQGTRLPCNGASDSTCTWAWKPWYKHGTDIPRMHAEQYTGRTVSGYALMFYPYSSTDDNLHGGIFRRESVEPCHTYRFSMWSRAGLDQQHPAPTDSRMRVGISPTGDYPQEIVLTDPRINDIIWSAPSNSKYAYEKLSVEAEAQNDTITVYTRADPDSNNQLYVFWDEGSFEEIPHPGDLVNVNQPLPGATGNIYNTNVQTSTNSATLSWNTGSTETIGQVLYRPLPADTPPSEPYTYTVYLPAIYSAAQAQDWMTSDIDDWSTSHQIQLTGLLAGRTYEYVIVSYGEVSGDCQALLTDTSSPRTFQTP
jgi:hypothetical protein